VNKLKQSTKQNQRKVLSQQTRQAITILQFNSVDLHKEIENIILENPFLEKEIDMQPEYNLEHSITSNNTDIEDVLNYHCDSENLREHLIKQLDTSSFTEEEEKIALIIIDCVDDNGYLTEDLKDVFIQANRLGEASFQDIFYILHTIQRFDPIGTCSINLCDSLNIQLDHGYKESKYYNKTKSIIDMLSKIDINEKLNFDTIIETINSNAYDKESIALLRKLNPKPGLIISKKLNTHHIYPDVIIFKRNNQWIVESTKNTPLLTLNKEYVSLLKDSKIKTDKDYLEKNYNQAKFIIRAISNRNMTVLNVSKEIFKRQSKFLNDGDIGLIPMTLKEISSSLGIHESTVSRATNNKYVQTPRGVYELKYFFSSELSTDTGKMVSSKAIMKMIEEVIKNENKMKPTSDSKISQYFKDQGVSVARRTVTKYREKMNIKKSTERKIRN
jgi:RNA polymerase sigma-54 factor